MATAQYLIDQIRKTLNDKVLVDGLSYHWKDAELLRWISDAQCEIVKYKPEANVVTSAFQPIEGSAFQELNAEVAHKLIRVEANDGGGAGDGIGITGAWSPRLYFTFGGANPNTQYTARTSEPEHSAVNRSVTVFILFAYNATNTTVLNALTYGGQTVQLYPVGGSFYAGSKYNWLWVGIMYWENGAPATDAVQASFNVLPEEAGFVAKTFDNVTLNSHQTHFLSVGPVSSADMPAEALVAGGVDILAYNADPYYNGHTPTMEFSPLATVMQHFTPTYQYALGYAEYRPMVDGNQAVSAREKFNFPTVWRAARLWMEPFAPAQLGSGTVIRMVQKDVLDSFFSGWTSSVTGGDPYTIVPDYYKAWAPSPVNPRGFYLYPTPRIEQLVHVTYAAIPLEVTSGAATLTLPDVYLDAIREYVVFRAYLKRARTYSIEAAIAALERFGKQLNLSRSIMNAITAELPRPTSTGPVTA
jgi:hypothetical protein